MLSWKRSKSARSCWRRVSWSAEWRSSRWTRLPRRPSAVMPSNVPSRWSAFSQHFPLFFKARVRFFDTVRLVPGRVSDPHKVSGGMMASVWSEVQTCIWSSWCHCLSLSLASVNPDWFYLSGTGSPGLFHTKSHLGDIQLKIWIQIHSESRFGSLITSHL